MRCGKNTLHTNFPHWHPSGLFVHDYVAVHSSNTIIKSPSSPGWQSWHPPTQRNQTQGADGGLQESAGFRTYPIGIRGKSASSYRASNHWAPTLSLKYQDRHSSSFTDWGRLKLASRVLCNLYGWTMSTTVSTVELSTSLTTTSHVHTRACSFYNHISLSSYQYSFTWQNSKCWSGNLKVCFAGREKCLTSTTRISKNALNLVSLFWEQSMNLDSSCVSENEGKCSKSWLATKILCVVSLALLVRPEQHDGLWEQNQQTMIPGETLENGPETDQTGSSFAKLACNAPNSRKIDSL